MKAKKRLTLLVLSVVCFLLSRVSSALGESPQPNQAQVAVSADPPAQLTLSPVDQPNLDLGLAPHPAQPLAPYVPLVQPQPAPAPALRPIIETKTAELKQTDPGLISRIVSATKGLLGFAVSWLGTEYIWGGISKAGVDCSGLTRLLYLTEGVSLPHSAKLQYKIGQAVAKVALLPGDLVFFNTTGPISHVGMYLGNGKFLHAANPRRGVRVDQLNSGYYLNHFAGARRYKSFG